MKRLQFNSRFRFLYPEMITFFTKFIKLVKASNKPTRIEIAIANTMFSGNKYININVNKTRTPFKVPSHVKQKLKKYQALKENATIRREISFLKGLSHLLETLLYQINERLDSVYVISNPAVERQRVLKDAARRAVKKEHNSRKKIYKTGTGNRLVALG